MSKTYLLGIDIGTSAAKLALFSRETGNRPLAVTDESYPLTRERPGWAEQDPRDWWRAVARGIPALLAAARVKPSEIAAVGIDGQSWAAVAIDREGNVLCPTPIWSDTRSADVCEHLKKTYGEECFFAVSGNPLAPGYTFPKLLWYREHRPDVLPHTAAVLQSNGYIVYRLTGKFSCDRSQGYGFACFDIRRGEFDRDLCRELGVDDAILPPLYDPHEIVGTVTAEAAAETGLAAGTPVVAGGLDSACDSFGTGVCRAGETQEQGGQSGGMSICLDTPVADRALILCRHVVKGKFLLQGGTVGGGALPRWFDREFGAVFAETAVKEKISTFAAADREAETVAPGADGLLLLPYFAGERSPVWDPQAKGVYYGLDYTKTRAHFVRANLEGAAFALRHNLETADRAGARATMLRASGGAAKSPLWTQIKADVTGCAVEVPQAFTASAFGAAALAGVAVGLYADFAEAAAEVTVTRTYTPNEANRAVYDRAYRTYLALYGALSPLMHHNQ